MCLSLGNAQTESTSTTSPSSINQQGVEEQGKKRLKAFLKVEDGTRGWFNAFVRSLYEEDKTVAGRGQVDNYLWANENYVAFHFFTYGGGANTHYICCVNSKGNVTSIEHMLTQSMDNDNYFDIERYGENEVFVTEQTQEQKSSNIGKSAEEKTYVQAFIFGINQKGAVTKRGLK